MHSEIMVLCISHRWIISAELLKCIISYIASGGCFYYLVSEHVSRGIKICDTAMTKGDSM